VPRRRSQKATLVIVCVVTRRFDLAAGIAEVANVFLELSLDSSTPIVLKARARGLVETHPHTFLSFLRTSRDDNTCGAVIVFNEKDTGGLPYDRVTDCPVDAGKLDLENVRCIGGTACARCRECFTEGVLERQRRMLHLEAAPETSEVLVQLRREPSRGGAS
jgi:hypothetical protein